MKNVIHWLAHFLGLNSRIEEIYYEGGLDEWILMSCMMCETCFKRTKIRVEGEHYFDKLNKPL